jgi:hypothetical protein
VAAGGQLRHLRAEHVRAARNAQTIGIDAGAFQLGVLPRHFGGGKSYLYLPRHHLEGLAGLYELLGVEVGHVAGKGDGRPGGNHLGNRPHAAGTVPYRGPQRLGANADRADDSHAGDDDFVHGGAHEERIKGSQMAVNDGK